MEFFDEWKSQFPIGKLFTPPLLLSGPSLGPLFFNPKPETLTLLLSYPSLSPSTYGILSPPPKLSLSRFLSTFSVPLSIASQFHSECEQTHHYQYSDSSDLSCNRLQLLYSPSRSSVIVFFPTGSNHDQLGFLVISCSKDSGGFDVMSDESSNQIFMAKNRFNSRICKILVNPIEEDVNLLAFEGKATGLITIGYLLAFTMYSIHWFSVKVNKLDETEKPALKYLGFKLFKSCSIAGACWSPHILEESVVLLQTGALFLFDIQTHNFKGKRLKVSWKNNDSASSKWLGCEFSWHPRILVIARSDAVFLVDLRSDGCNISLLAKIDMLNLYASVEKERFLAFCKAAGSDGFNFILASETLLILCDLRKPLMPVLQWAHGLHKPSYIDSFRLSELRSNSRDDTYEWANELGFGIVLGSFWNCEFNLFCYGPSLPGQGEPFASQFSKFCKSLYAWDLPSDLFLSGCDCCCGDCRVREQFLKDALPKWVGWQQKKDIVLGFGLLSSDFSAVLHERDEFGGFTLIRLMSSGKLEAQRYCASWELVKKFELAHDNSFLRFENNLLRYSGGEDYKFPKRYKYFDYEYLYAHLGGNLTELMDLKLKNPSSGPQGKESFSVDIHEILCKNLKVCGFSRFRTSPAISFVFGDINLPATIWEVALRRIWACLPMELLQLAFSSYTEILETLLDKKMVSLEFLVIPDMPQLPPFFLRKPSCRSNKWSQKVQCTDAVVGPVLPLPVLVTLHEFHNGCPNSEEETSRFSSEVELGLCCAEVVKVACEMSVSDSAFEFHDEHSVSLADDRDEMWVDSRKSKPFILYHPTSFECLTKDRAPENYVYKDARFFNLISKVSECEPFSKDKGDGVVLELYDDLCPIALKYDACNMTITSPELRTYNIIKRQFLRWQEGFSPYQDFCTRLNLRKQ